MEAGFSDCGTESDAGGGCRGGRSDAGQNCPGRDDGRFPCHSDPVCSEHVPFFRDHINGVLDGGGDTGFDMYSLAVSMWGIAIPLALLGAFVWHWPVLAVYACTCLDEVGKIPWVMLRFRKYKWVKDLTR